MKRNRSVRVALIPNILAVLVLAGAARLALAADATAEIPRGKGTHADLVALLDEFLHWQDPERAKGQNEVEEVAGASNPDADDYSAAAVERRRARMKELQARLDDMNVAAWNRKQQVDYLAVRARFNQYDFTLNVSKPWSRDPGFYVDQMLRVTFTELPVKGAARDAVRNELRSMPKLVAQAKQNLTEVAADYADLAIFNLANADGVGHGFPYRAVPPPGVIGWYADLLGRAEKQQRELVPDIKTAKKAAEDLLAWLKANRASMTAQAGVGRENFNWYLKNVKLMPYTADQILTLGHRELERLWAVYALEQHHNRNLPPLKISQSKEEYEAKIKATDEHVRKFLVEQE